MPHRAARPCRWPGCPALVRDGSYCPLHQREMDRRYNAQRGTVTEQGYGHDWQKIRRAFLAEHRVCARCGRPARHVDHIIARARGGTDDEGNLQALCGSCHSRKTATVDGGGWKRQ